MAELARALRSHELMGLDTSPFIYHIEGRSRFAEPAGVVFDELARGALDGVTSVLTLMELVVRPLQMGRRDVADEYETLVANYPNLVIANVDRTTARRAAELRAVYRLRSPDALQIAACLQAGADLFVTNDRDLRRVKEIEVILLEDFTTD